MGSGCLQLLQRVFGVCVHPAGAVPRGMGQLCVGDCWGDGTSMPVWGTWPVPFWAEGIRAHISLLSHSHPELRSCGVGGQNNNCRCLVNLAPLVFLQPKIEIECSMLSVVPQIKSAFSRPNLWLRHLCPPSAAAASKLGGVRHS